MIRKLIIANTADDDNECSIYRLKSRLPADRAWIFDAVSFFGNNL
jgi:hypothetical protein